MGLNTLLPGRIRLLQHLSNPAAVTRAPFFGPKVLRLEEAGRDAGGWVLVDHRSHFSWEGGGTWEDSARGASQRGGRDIGNSAAGGLLHCSDPKSTDGEPAESCSHIFSASGRSCPVQGLCFQTRHGSQGLLSDRGRGHARCGCSL